MLLIWIHLKPFIRSDCLTVSIFRSTSRYTEALQAGLDSASQEELTKTAQKIHSLEMIRYEGASKIIISVN